MKRSLSAANFWVETPWDDFADEFVSCGFADIAEKPSHRVVQTDKTITRIIKIPFK
jgi:hypothetical protein